MSKGKMNPKVDFFFSKSTRWQKELDLLRNILLGVDLNEELKWGVPCYTHLGKNIVLMHEFKDYCALLFFKGVLLKDPKKILIQQTKNVQVARQIRFTNAQEIAKLSNSIKVYTREAIDIEKSGAKANLKKTSEFSMPEEFQTKLDKMPSLKKAFKTLTPGRQRGYLLHFSSPKQTSTRESRIKKSIPQILQGKGLND